MEVVPIAPVGLQLDEALRMAVRLRLGVILCEAHVCRCGAQVDARDIHELMCKRNAGRHPRHGLSSYVIWRAIQRAQIPSAKEPAGLIPTTKLRPDGASYDA